MNDRIAKFMFLAAEYLRGERVDVYLKQMEVLQWQSRTDIHDFQSRCLRSLTSFAIASNPYYKAKYEGIDPIENFGDLPLLTKQELRRNARQISTPGWDRRLRLCKTSGSTGEPLAFFRDGLSFGHSLASAYRGQRWYGLDIGSRMAMLWGIPSTPMGRLQMRMRDVLLNRFRQRDIDLSDPVLTAFFSRLHESRPRFLFGYPSMVYEFALFCRDHDLDIRGLSLRCIICTAESILDHQRSLIEDVFSCPVVSEYGSAETGIISYQCPEGNHHISDDTIFVEILDDNDNPVRTGDVGRVVVTVLFSHGAPIIRYDLGDVAIASNEVCPCGVGLSLLDRIVGRTTGVIITPAGERIHSSSLSYIMKEYAIRYDEVRQFRIHQTHVDRIEVHLVVDGGLSEESHRWLETSLLRRFGGDMHFEFVVTPQLRRSASGKLSSFETDLDTHAGGTFP